MTASHGWRRHKRRASTPCIEYGNGAAGSDTAIEVDIALMNDKLSYPFLIRLSVTENKTNTIGAIMVKVVLSY
jgi:hypothetical protein